MLTHYATRRRFSAGTLLARQGEVSDRLYIIVAGQVRVERSHPAIIGPVVLDDLGPGEVVGELRGRDAGPRFATAVALEDTEALELPQRSLERSIARSPEAVASLLDSLSQPEKPGRPRVTMYRRPRRRGYTTPNAAA